MKKVISTIIVIFIALTLTGCGKNGATKSVRKDYIKENNGIIFNNYAIAIDDKNDNKNTYAVYKRIKSNKYQRLFRINEDIKNKKLLASNNYLYIIDDSIITGYRLNSSINNVKSVTKNLKENDYTISKVYGFKDNYIYVSLSNDSVLKLKADLSSFDVLKEKDVITSDLSNNIN